MYTVTSSERLHCVYQGVWVCVCEWMPFPGALFFCLSTKAGMKEAVEDSHCAMHTSMGGAVMSTGVLSHRETGSERQDG